MSGTLVAGYLLSDQLSDPAARTLTTIGTPAAGRALFKALSKAEGVPLISVVEALGNIRYSDALKKISRLIHTNDPVLKKVILHALAQFGMPESGPLLYAEALNKGFLYEPTLSASSYVLWLERIAENGNGEITENN
jgi:hypothetical protein